MWFPLEQTLWTHRKTYALADDLGIDEVHAGGLVARLWSWSLDNAQADFDGRRGLLTGVVPLAIAGGAGWKGEPVAFVAALTGAGFLDQDGDDLVIHDWFDYAGRLLERRRRDRERKRAAAEKARRSGTSGRPSRAKAIPQETRGNNAEPARNKTGRVAATVQTLLTESLNSTEGSAPLPPTPVVSVQPAERAPESDPVLALAVTRLQAIPKPKDAERAATESHPLFEPLVTLFGKPPARELPAWRDDLATLDEMGALPEDIPRAAEAYVAIMGHDNGRPIPLTRPALVRNWYRCIDAASYPDDLPGAYQPQEAGIVTWSRRYGYAADQASEASP
jgi:hypothetical protein